MPASSAATARSARPPRSPTMPRDSTAAPENGSMLPIACSEPSSSRNNAACSPLASSTPTPRPGISRSYAQAVVHTLNVVEQRHDSSLDERTTGTGNGTLRPTRSVNATVGIGGVGGVDEGHEPRQLLRVVEHARPLVGVAVDVAGHRRLELGGQPERVVARRPRAGGPGRRRAPRSTARCAAAGRRCGCRTSGTGRCSGSASRCRGRRPAARRAWATCRRCRRRRGSSRSRWRSRRSPCRAPRRTRGRSPDTPILILCGARRPR